MDYTVVTARQTGNNRTIAAVTQITCTNRANLYVKREAIHKNIEKTVSKTADIKLLDIFVTKAECTRLSGGRDTPKQILPPGKVLS